MTPHANEDTTSNQKTDNMSNNSATLTNGETPRSRALSVSFISLSIFTTFLAAFPSPSMAIAKRTLSGPSQLCRRNGLEQHPNLHRPVTPRLQSLRMRPAALPTNLIYSPSNLKHTILTSTNSILNPTPSSTTPLKPSRTLNSAAKPSTSLPATTPASSRRCTPTCSVPTQSRTRT
jgi:hypothetical protein